MALFPPLNKRNTRNKEKACESLRKGHIGELGTRYLSTPNRGQGSMQRPQYNGTRTREKPLTAALHPT